MSTVLKGLAVSLLAGLAVSHANTDPQVHPSAGPRTGTIFTIEIALNQAGDLDRLTGLNVDISDANDSSATLHVTPDEYAMLQSAGFDIRIIPSQPRETPRANEKGLGVYHDYAGLTSELEAFAGDHPGISRLYTLGSSAEGRELWALLITDNPDTEEDEPEFKYVSTMHGDEPVGTEMCLNFIDMLLTNYGVNDRVTGLVDSTEIWVVPLMNPDGLELGSRYNARGFDLNRSFPAFDGDFEDTLFDGAPLDADGRPPEVQHVMEWTVDNSFVLSANLHTGALVVNYPYDHEPGIRSGQYAISPDDALFRELSLVYAMHNAPMSASSVFPNGITNGSDWFSIIGGMQDWNYRYAACLEVTIELSVPKRPPQNELSALWNDNAESMLSYAEAVHRGIRGIITDRDTGEPIWAKITVDGSPRAVFTDPDVGDYHRVLLPGQFRLRVSAPGYVTWTAENVQVAEDNSSRVDVALADPDVNNDGAVDGADVQQVLLHLLREPCPVDCDLDGGGLSSTDLQALVNFVLEGAGDDPAAN